MKHDNNEKHFNSKYYIDFLHISINEQSADRIPYRGVRGGAGKFNTPVT